MVEVEAAQKKGRKTAGSLREVANTPTRVKAFGREYEVKRFSLRDVAEAVTYLNPLSYVLSWLDAFEKDADGRPLMSKSDMMQVALRAVTISGDSVIGLVSVITKEPVEWVEAQDPMDALEVLVCGVERNMDFFSEKNMRRAKDLFARLGKVLPGRGTTPSGSSSSGGTEQETTS